MIVGIDFGTTRTVVAAPVGGGYTIVYFDIDGQFVEYIPGMVAVEQAQLVCGWEAVRALSEGASGARSLKRIVAATAPDAPVLLGEQGSHTALDLLTQFLRDLRTMLLTRSNLEFAGEGAIAAAISVPAGASTRQRYLTIEAFKRAGFDVRVLLNEPTAAAIDLAHEALGAIGNRSPKRYVVVYDLGGGTFDVAAVSLEERSFALLASEGISQLGGDDFDQVIADLVLEELGTSGAELDLRKRTLLLERCRETKESLRPTSRRLLIDLSGFDLSREEVVLDANEVYTRCEPLITRTLELVDRVFERVRDHGIDPDDSRQLGGLYIVGGSASFPPVGRALRERYGRKVRIASRPDGATALGLAARVDPERHVEVREAVTRHFGVWREGEGGQKKVFDQIFSKGSTGGESSLPISVERVYRPRHSIGRLRFLECEAIDEKGEPTGDITPWTEIVFPYDAALVDRDDLAEIKTSASSDPTGDEIVEMYTYATDGSIRVAIENRSRGYRREFALGSLG